MMSTNTNTVYEMTVGIECHVQLATKTKLFSPADNDARSKEPNAVVHPIDFGLPGMLPILNRKAVDLAILAGKALNAPIAHMSRFDRKHYFYPDLPKGYQISQMYQPIILSGYVDAPLDDGSMVRVRIHHAHMEEDAGKLTHYGDCSLIDLNRAGTPLIEIVSEPDIHSPAAAKAYAAELHKLMVFAGVTNGDLYHGNMRFDVNISVAKKDSEVLGTRAEIKNLNSFRSVERAAAYEFQRQVDLLEHGERVVQETRGWDDAKQQTFSQRSKEDAQDYRYMPDADIPPVVLDDEEIAKIQADLPMLPPQYRARWSTLSLDLSVVNALLSNQVFSRIVVSAQDAAGDESARRIANWFASVVAAQDGEQTSDTSAVKVKEDSVVGQLIDLAGMVDRSELSSTGAKAIFTAIMQGDDRSPRAIAAEKNVLQVSDESEIATIVDSVMNDPMSAASIAAIRAGKEKAIGYLVGQVMKQSQGKANPALAQKMIRERL